MIADIAENAETAAMFFQGSVGDLAKAAIEAASLGTSISDAASVANNLLDFENSINDEINFCNNKIDEKKSEIEITNNGIVWYNWFEDFDNHYNLIKSYTKLEDKKNFINQFVDKITVYWDSISNTHKLVITFKLKIVKDQRIKEEKYVFKLQKGQNDKVISDINSKKYNKLINQKSKLLNSH